jgi:hypothetical protein
MRTVSPQPKPAPVHDGSGTEGKNQLEVMGAKKQDRQVGDQGQILRLRGSRLLCLSSASIFGSMTKRSHAFALLREMVRGSVSEGWAESHVGQRFFDPD